ncbi:dihydrouridine synthase-domain-containing protein [Pelagophyceae sp. CCMP2097]|nr:dihydrouridine synthase-domain-containing protein [Pelagophyceae sp. CCMP2097]
MASSTGAAAPPAAPPCAAPPSAKLRGWAWFESLGSPKFVCAPMVDQSELAFRNVARKHNVTLCYTPMLLAAQFHTDESYRKAYYEDDLPDDDSDRPLIVQLGGADVDFLVGAALAIERSGRADAVDLNLGCPQSCARRTGYGAFLAQDAAVDLVRALDNALTTLPVTCKIRAVPAPDDDLRASATLTARFAARLAAAGASLIAVHARTRRAKSRCAADWEVIKAVVEAVDIPVLGNGNIRSRSDALRLVAATGAAGVMSADSLLKNPRLFADGGGSARVDAAGDGASKGGDPAAAAAAASPWRLAEEYAAACVALPASKRPPLSWAQAHVLAIFGDLPPACEHATTHEALLAAVVAEEDVAGGAGSVGGGEGGGDARAAASATRARLRKARHGLKAARARAAKDVDTAPAPRELSEKTRAAIDENRLALCASGCGQPGKKSCARNCCARCCRSQGGGDCGHHEPKKKKRRAAAPGPSG